MDNSQAIHKFWSSFGLNAYDETYVPDKTEYPYITYEVIDSGINEPISMSASLWYKTTSWEKITKKADEIKKKLSNGGIIINTDSGAMWINKGTPFYMRVPDENQIIRHISMNIYVEYIEE